MVLRQGVIIIVLGLAVGLVCAFGLAQLAAGVVTVGPADPVTYLSVLAALSGWPRLHVTYPHTPRQDSRATLNQVAGIWLPTSITPTVEGPIAGSSGQSYWGSQAAAFSSFTSPIAPRANGVLA